MQMMKQAVMGMAIAAFSYTQSRDDVDFFRKADYRLPMVDRLRFEGAAPIIVLGGVLEVSYIGEPHPSFGDSRILVQRTRLKIEVEQVVKGTIPSNPFDMELFTFSSKSSIDLGVPRYNPSVGQRRLYFLRQVNNIYRSVGDVTNYNLPITSGRHDKEFCKGKKPGCCIAELLLIPGQDFDTKWFIARLNEAGYAASVLCSKNVAVELLKRLLQSPDKEVGDRANEILRSVKRAP